MSSVRGGAHGRQGWGVGNQTSRGFSFCRFENFCTILLDPESDAAVIGFGLSHSPDVLLPVLPSLFTLLYLTNDCCIII